MADASKHGLINAILFNNDGMDLQRHRIGILCLIIIQGISVLAINRLTGDDGPP